jgi:DNA-binding transcriptional LysR family regulator
MGLIYLTKKELIYITTVAEYGNISKAADTLLVTQPSLSRCIQKVESDLGTELFKRTSDGLILTDAGNYYIESAKQILKIYKELEGKVSHLNELKAGTLTIATASAIGAEILPHVLPVFTSLYPNVKVKIVEGTSSDT